MKKLMFNSKEYNIPENWSEVTLKMVIDVQELSDLLEDSPIIAIIAGYTGIDTSEIKSSNVKEMNDILSIMEFINTPYVPTPTNEFTFAGVKYSAEPDLVSHEFQDWLSIQTIMYNNRENPIKGLSRMLAVYCKKSGEKLDDFNVSDRAKMFEGLPFTVAKDVECFFLACLNAWQKVTLLSSKEQDLQKLTLERFTEVSNIMKVSSRGYGWYSPTRWLIGIYRRYLLYLRKQLERSFNSTRTDT